MAECNKCIMEQRIERIEEDIKKDSGSRKEIYGRLAKLESNYAGIDVKLTGMEVKLVNIEQKLDEVRLAPANRWGQLVDNIMRWLVPIALTGAYMYLNKG